MMVMVVEVDKSYPQHQDMCEINSAKQVADVAQDYNCLVFNCEHQQTVLRTKNNPDRAARL